MNINVKSNYDTAEAINIRLFSDKLKNREVDTANADIESKANIKSIADETLRVEKDKIQEKIHQAVTMDVSEVKDFLFMLIGAEVKVKPDNDNSGTLINRLA
ncbi:MAG: hypothetical protein CVV49_16055 [Spirochaetae bacterium HGW-Spirochaetae-5]|nr:MAG: hypothetical protein CVV49_16055 [Spirochaetae bacterium HGW-Spirochaetae-5]